MKHFFTSLLTTAAILSISPMVQADTFKTKRCINMGNALDAPTEGAWGHRIDRNAFKLIADAGFDTVRIPVRWSAHTGGAPYYKIDERFFRRVSQVIDQALANNLQVIVNVHHFEELNEDPHANYNKFMALWSQIAPRYKNLPKSVYFEVINEPSGAFQGDLMRRVVTDAFKKIRESNPTRIIIMGGDEWSNIKTLPSIPSIRDSNQVHTFHYYDPFEFTHQKASWTDLKNSRTVRWGSSADKRQLKAAAEYAARVQRKTGIPIFLGEIGAYEKAPYKDAVDYTRETRLAFENAGISWCAWNFTATFPFYNSDVKQWDRNKLAALGLSPNGYIAKPAQARSTAAAYQGQSIDDAFNELRRQIGQDGALLMAPYADQLNSYGDAQGKIVQDRGAPDGQAMDVRILRKGRKPWDSGLTGSLSGSIKRGDVLVMSYWAKAVQGQGVISNAGLQLNSEPYTAMVMKPASLGPEWQRFTVSTKAQRNYGPSEAGFVIQLAGAKQTVRFGPVFIMNFGPNVNAARLP